LVSEFLQNIVAISAGNHHVLALDVDGYVWGWGKNQFGQLGNGTTSPSSTPVQVKVGPDTPLYDIVSIDAGFEHSMAIDNDGCIWVWGRNEFGELGLDDKNNRNYATRMPE
jgi:alpha-tubulin suppressor-like RCC1 family protein